MKALSALSGVKAIVKFLYTSPQPDATRPALESLVPRETPGRRACLDQPLLTPRLRRTSMLGFSASFTIRSDKLIARNVVRTVWIIRAEPGFSDSHCGETAVKHKPFKIRKLVAD